jgi:cold shock CspA family protein/ribosome-associated translation inhibitor RaiA
LRNSDRPRLLSIEARGKVALLLLSLWSQEGTMLTEPQITFRHMTTSPALLADIQRRIAWLERFHPAIVGCHVAVEAPRKHHRQGGLFRVRVEISVPGGEVVVSRSPPAHQSHADVYVAVRDAFRAARRELMDRARLMRGDVKGHAAPQVGQVARTFDEPRGRYGFLETPEGREVYFHEHALLDEWEDLAAGDRVRFVEESGNKGPQASTVEKIGPAPHPRPGGAEATG